MYRLTAMGLVVLLIQLFACEKQAEFDKQALLENITTTIVVNNYEEGVSKVSALKQAVEQFNNNPDLMKLEAAQDAWRAAMRAWSKVEGLYFGPGEDSFRYLQLDNTPIRATSVEAGIMDTATIDLNYIQQRSSYTKGLSTIEYLLFDNGDNTVVLQKYQSGLNRIRRKDYLYYSVVHALELLEALTNDWKNSYGAELARMTDNSSTAGIARFTNMMMHLVQTVARKKVGKPLGKENSSNTPQPSTVESLYAQYSWEIVQGNLVSIQEIFGNSQTGIGSYLNYLLGDDSNTQKIANQLEKIITLIDQRPNSLKTEVTTQTTEVEAIYTELSTLYTMFSEDYLPYISVTLLANPDDGD